SSCSDFATSPSGYHLKVGFLLPFFADRRSSDRCYGLLYASLTYQFQAKKNQVIASSLLMVGTERLELSHLAALEPKSSASTNFATSPLAVYIIVGTHKR